MTKKTFLSLLILMFIVTLAACKSKGGGGGTEPIPDERPAVITPATPGTLISSPDPKPITSFLQTVSNADFYGIEYFQNQANIWDIDNTFALVNMQLPWAIDLTVGGTFFPADQVYGELTFYTPLLGQSEGIQIASVSDGSRIDYSTIGATGIGMSAYIAPTSDSRLQQTVSLPSGTTYTLTWADDSFLQPGRLSGYIPQYSVMIRDTAGNALRTVFTTTTGSAYDGINGFPMDEFAGQTIVLSFEVRSAPDYEYQTFTVLDDVAIFDPSGMYNYNINGSLSGMVNYNYVKNGDFEAGLSYWTTNTPSQVQNMTSGTRTLEGLAVTRSFYTVPNKLWGRWVDVFTNPTGSSITKTITYESALGSGGSGIIYRSIPGDTRIRALSSWDSEASVRDVGFVFGKAATVDYNSASGLVSYDGNDIITVTYDITVPANGSVSLVNFVIMNGKYTGQSASTATAKASEIDNETYKILTKFWTEAQYRDGMSQEQMDAIVNF